MNRATINPPQRELESLEFLPGLLPPNCLHELFEEKADQYPDSIALLYEDETLTYRQLDGKANQLARYLRSRAVKPGTFVALLLPRSLDAFVCLLAVLKTGAAYVPLDPEYPLQRVSSIITDCGAGLLLTHSSLNYHHSSLPCPVILLDKEWDKAIFLESQERLDSTGATDKDIAYVIYTSGTTGKPKGVMIEHRSVCQFIRSESLVFAVNNRDRIYQGFSLAFDASVEEVWLAFYAGATLVVATYEVAHCAQDLTAFLTRHRITVFSCVPTLLTMMEGEMPTVRLLILGGERCTDGLVAQWRAPDRRIVNTYGPTEATVVTTFADCEAGKAITIGHPLPHYEVYILDEHLEEAPRGIAGEIHIGGPCLARGYLNQQDLTDMKFIPHPFRHEGGLPRLYKTGDLGRVLENGDIEFLGRIDGQVKLRGFRIELAEIEAVLREWPGVKYAIVDLREDLPGCQQLVAYVVTAQDLSFDEVEARAFLKAKLAPFMVPAVIETIEQPPTLPSGKIDKSKLPPPRQQHIHKKCVAPRTAPERKLLSLWQSLFHPVPVSVTDDFFEIGGHSLLATRLVSELRREPGFRSVSVADVYHYTTLEALALRLEQIERENVQKDSAHTFNASDTLDQIDRTGKGRQGLIRSIPQSLLSTLQLASTYMLHSFSLVQIVAPFFLAAYLTGAHTVMSLEVLPFVFLSFPAIEMFFILLAVAAKWLVIGRFKAGSYPVRSFYYYRFWFVRRLLNLVPVFFLRGTPFITLYYRMLGARIGPDVYLGTNQLFTFDLLSIGKDSSIGVDVQLLGYHVEKGMLILGPITVGERCYAGARSVVSHNAAMEDDAHLMEMSLLPAGKIIPRLQKWSGSPASFFSMVSGKEQGQSKQQALMPHSRLKKPLYTGLHFLGLLLLPVFPLAASIPSIVLYTNLVESAGFVASILSLPFLTALFTALLLFEIGITKWLLVQRIRDGRYKVNSLFYVRKWFVDCLMHMSLFMLNPVYATLYLPPWLRFLGARLGKRVEVSTVAHVSPDHIDIGEESFVADDAFLGAPSVHLGMVDISTVRVGRRSFIGNSALLPVATRIGEGCLVGCLSVPPRENKESTKKGTSWFGSPAIVLPRRQESPFFSDVQTFHPPLPLYLVRGCIEFFRITLPAFFLLSSYRLSYHLITGISWRLGPVAAGLIYPAVYAVCIGSAALGVIGLKWILMGRYKPCQRPLWNHFVWRTELVTALHESFCVPFLLDMLQGTPFLAWYFRLMGARIGKRVHLETTHVTEYDLVTIEDGASLNSNCTIQTHLFEDRVMKMSHLKVGKDCSVGIMSVVLYDSTMEENSSLGSLSLLMKGETLPPGTRWEGIPARLC